MSALKDLQQNNWGKMDAFETDSILYNSRPCGRSLHTLEQSPCGSTREGQCHRPGARPVSVTNPGVSFTSLGEGAI